MERTWATITLTERFEVCSRTSVARAAARSAGSTDHRPAGGVVEVFVERSHRFGELAQRIGHRRGNVVADVQRARCAAAERLDALARRADLDGGLLVAAELLAAAAAERCHAQRLAPGGDGVLQVVEAKVPGARPGLLGEFAVAPLQRRCGVLERAGDLFQQRRGGAPYDLHGIARKQRRDGERDHPAQQGVEEAHARETRPRSWMVTTSSADAAASPTSAVLPPKAITTTIAPQTTAAICAGPVPINATSASAIPMPRAMPITISTAEADVGRATR